MARTREMETGTVELPALGEEGDACGQCGSVLATDQRYCLNCGARRSGPRTDYETRLAANGGAAAALNGAGATRMPAAREWSPVTVIGTVAVLGVMLLLGVLIGKDDSKTTQVAAAPATTTAAPTATTPTTPTPTTATTPAKAKKGKGKSPGGAGAAAPGAGPVEKGGSGSTAGVPAAQTNLGTGDDYAKNSKKTPDVQATSGAPAQQDPNGQAGDGTKPAVIK